MSKGKAAGAGIAAGLLGVLLIVLCGAFLGFKGLEGGQPEPTPSVDYEVQFDFPDCDKDDRSPKWDVKDCGPSPTPAAKKTRGTVPAPKKTRR